MSVKALEKEYQKVYDQYQEMLTDIKDIEADANNGLCDPELVDRLKEQIKPIKQNYEWWCYVMYILHEPQRKAKQARYKKMNINKLQQLSKTNSPAARLSEGRQALNGLKELTNGRATY